MSAISNITSTPTAASLDALNAETNAQGKQELGADDFLKLLTVQLSSQDPLKPMEDTAFISQMASFTSLQQMRTLTQNFADFTKQEGLTAANSYLGKSVTVTDSTGSDVTGVVDSITVQDGVPNLMINGTSYGLDVVTGVTSQPITTAPASTDSTTATPSN